jgi:hypothetical protein
MQRTRGKYRGAIERAIDLCTVAAAKTSGHFRRMKSNWLTMAARDERLEPLRRGGDGVVLPCWSTPHAEPKISVLAILRLCGFRKSMIAT